MSTQLYNKNHDSVYPYTKGSSVLTDVIPGITNVDDSLIYLNDLISEITNDKEAVTAINVVVYYCVSKTKSESELKSQEQSWSNKYVTPSPEFPYAWKKTEIFVASTKKEFYEIIASYNSDTTQNIYLALSSNDTQPTIIYPKILENGVTVDKEDLTAFDLFLPGSPGDTNNNLKWTEIPQSISAQTPYVYISTRKRIDGLWERFSTPALLGRWAFDSKLELRYLHTDSDVSKENVSFNKSSINPGQDWNSTSPDFEQGKLWMITATSVNGVLNKDEQGIIWNGPHLLAYIK